MRITVLKIRNLASDPSTAREISSTSTSPHGKHRSPRLREATRYVPILPAWRVGSHFVARGVCIVSYRLPKVEDPAYRSFMFKYRLYSKYVEPTDEKNDFQLRSLEIHLLTFDRNSFLHLLRAAIALFFNLSACKLFVSSTENTRIQTRSSLYECRVLCSVAFLFSDRFEWYYSNHDSRCRHK
jgi:hypothetical protein